MKIFKMTCVIFLVLSLVSCASLGIGPNSTYYMGTTAFNYDPSYNPYDVRLNGHEIGAGGLNTLPVKVGPQVITWCESNSDKNHRAKNKVI